ncbi:MAG: primosomal protein N' [Phycisphaerae bacterium]|nr:primosomal protein N' [Phycisphaerae bacterium]
MGSPPLLEGLFPAETPAVRAELHALVAVERGVDRYPDGLLYAVPDGLDVGEGDRVTVPLGGGNQPTDGTIVRFATSAEVDALDCSKVKSILARDAEARRLPGELLQLARWLSGYYCCPIGMTLVGMLPAAVRKGIGAVTRTYVHRAETAETAPPAGLSKKQAELLTTLAAIPVHEQPVELRDLMVRAGIATSGPMRALAAKGLVRLEHRTAIEASFERAGLESGPPPTLTSAQRTVIDAVDDNSSTGFSQHLLFGVTGSGKTEVYIQLVQRVLDAGKKAMVLVPEIALTPQTAGRLVSRFPGRRVAILHSGLTAAQRHHMWDCVAAGDADIILGARSAVFAPVPDGTLGIVIVDEEHDSSYKADQAPRYHGRDVAIRRAQLAKCPVLLGSGTPSLESWMNAVERHVSTLHRLPERAPGLNVPRVDIVDFNKERKQFTDRRVNVIGPTLRAALQATLASGGQAVILLNRRGYANYIACVDPHCDWVLRCDQCDAGMICHRDKYESHDGAMGIRDYTRCHHCESEVRLPKQCPRCGKKVTVFGLGTQRVEEELHRLFPSLVEGATMLRVDADAMHGERDFRDALGRFAAGEVKVLLGTQMISKGLDFPNVRLVGVISADTALHLPDFRAAERTFQLVSQVSGRCGRGAAAGRAIIQTFQPNAPPILRASKHDFEGFAAAELAERVRFGLPPARRMARFVVRDAGETRCRQLAEELVAGIQPHISGSVEVRGPAPCPIARIAGRYRQQVEVFADTAAELTRFLTAVRNVPGLLVLGEVVAVDVDPIALL